jgi:hypothetical protein
MMDKDTEATTDNDTKAKAMRVDTSEDKLEETSLVVPEDKPKAAADGDPNSTESEDDDDPPNKDKNEDSVQTIQKDKGPSVQNEDLTRKDKKVEAAIAINVQSTEKDNEDEVPSMISTAEESKKNPPLEQVAVVEDTVMADPEAGLPAQNDEVQSQTKEGFHEPMELDPIPPLTSLKATPPSWSSPDVVPSWTNNDPTSAPKELNSQLCQRMFEICLIYKAAYPNMKTMPHALLEFLTRSITDDHLRIDDPAVNNANMKVGAFFCTLPVCDFKDVVPSYDLMTKLGVKGGFKKKKPKLFGDKLPSSHRFWVVHHNGRWAKSINTDSYLTNKENIKHFSKFEAHLVSFFIRQFDQMSIEEQSSVKKGLQNDNNTLYVIGLDNGLQYHVVAAVQYVAVHAGVFVNWLAVENSGHERNHYGSSSSHLMNFRRIGLGGFLQELLLLMQSARGWKPTIFLQSNVGSRACIYYVHRGYKRAPENNLESLQSLLPLGSFDKKSINFVTDATQLTDKTPAAQKLYLHFHEGHFESSFLEPVITFILPAQAHELLFEFPFNCTGFMLDHFLEGNEFYLFSDSVFGKKGTEEYSMRDAANQTSCNKDFREEGMYDWIYDTAGINLDCYQKLCDPDTPHVSDPLVDFWSVWMLRNTGGWVQEDVAIIPLIVCRAFEKGIELSNLSMKHPSNSMISEALTEVLAVVDKYLWAHKDLLQKRLIFYTANCDPGDWLGLVAVNPWVRLVVYADEQERKTPAALKDIDVADEILHGIFHNNSSGTEVGQEDTYSFLWFLNLASRYRDLRLKQTHLLFNYEKMVSVGVPPQHLIHLSWEGPFGILEKLKPNEEPVFKLLDQEIGTGFYRERNHLQNGMAWCIFMYDVILSVHCRSLFQVDIAPPYVGCMCHTSKFFTNAPKTPLKVKVLEISIVQGLYNLFRFELQTTIERIRYLYVQNGDIAIPTGWGYMTDSHRALLDSKAFKKNVLPLLEKIKKHRFVRHPSYNKELHIRLKLMDASEYDPVTDTSHMFKSNEYAGHILREEWFVPHSTEDSDEVEEREVMVEFLVKESEQEERWMKYLENDHPEPSARPLDQQPKRGKPEPIPCLKPAPIVPIVTADLPSLAQGKRDPPPLAQGKRDPPQVTQDPPPLAQGKRDPPQVTQDATETTSNNEKPKANNKVHKAPRSTTKLTLRTRNKLPMSWYEPTETSAQPVRSKRRKNPQRQTTLAMEWNYLPDRIAQGLIQNVLGEDELTPMAVDNRREEASTEPRRLNPLTSFLTPDDWPEATDLMEMQRDRAVAKALIRKNMNMPRDKKQEKYLRQRIESERQRDAYDRWLNNANEQVDVEAALMQYDGVTRIGWVPDNTTSIPKTTEGPLKGHYTLEITRDDGSKTMVVAENDWVEAHYPREVLEIVQDKAYEKMELMETTDKSDEAKRRGFFVVEGTEMVDVEGCGIGVKLDDDIINRIKFVKERQSLAGPIFEKDTKGEYVKDRKGNCVRMEREERTIKARWVGYSNKTKRIINLETKWVEANFDKKFLSQIKNMSTKSVAFVAVPPGDDKVHEKGSFEALAIGPKIKYLQKEGERTCMVYSMASVIHDMGAKQLASEIRNAGKKFEFKVNAFGHFLSFLQRKHRALNARRENKTLFDLLSVPKDCLVMACIKGQDGKEDHCVCVYNEWIFDSNFDKAIVLSDEGLGICCSSVNETTRFDGCAEVVTFPDIYLLH